jgi:hypothetical protein
MYTLGKAPVRWNPCAPIHYRVNLRNAPPGALADVKKAVAEISRATRITFKYDGATTVIPTSKYTAKYRPGRTTPPPLVIAWATKGTGPGQSDLLRADTPMGDNLGVGGPVYAYWYDSRGRYHKARYVTGSVVMNAAHNDELPAGLVDGVPGRGQVLVHELGHVMGLQHTSDKTQVMYPIIGPYATFGAGDHAGLRLLGRSAGCIR